MDWRARRWLFLVELGNQVEREARAAMQVPPAKLPPEEAAPLVEWLALLGKLSRLLEAEARQSLAQARVVQRLAREAQRRSARWKGGEAPSAIAARLCQKHRANPAAKSSSATSPTTAARAARTASTKSRRVTKR